MPETNRGPEPRNPIKAVIEELVNELSQRAPLLNWSAHSYWMNSNDGLPDCIMIHADVLIRGRSLYAEMLLDIESYERSILSIEDYVLPAIANKIAEVLVGKED